MDDFTPIAQGQDDFQPLLPGPQNQQSPEQQLMAFHQKVFGPIGNIVNSIGNKVGQVADKAKSVYQNAFTPEEQNAISQSKVGQLGSLVNKGLGAWSQVGASGNAANQQMMQAAAGKMGEKGVNPYLAAALTTPYAMASEMNPFLPKTKGQAAISALTLGSQLGGEAKAAQSQASSAPGSVSPGKILGSTGDETLDAFRQGSSSQLPGSSQSPTPSGNSLVSFKKSLTDIAEKVKAPMSPADTISEERNFLLQSHPQIADEIKSMSDPDLLNSAASRSQQNIAQLMPKINENLDKMDPTQTRFAYNSMMRDMVRIQHSGDIAVMQPEFEGTMSRMANKLAQTEGSATETAAGQAVKPNPPGQMAQLIAAKAGRGRITPSVAQYAIDHPNVLTEAPSLEKATSDYVEGIPGLEGKVANLSQRLNKTIIRPGDYDSAIDRVGRILDGTPLKGEPAEMSPQEALTGLQTINRAVRNKQFTAGMDNEQLGSVMQRKDQLLDYLQDNGSPKIRELSKNLFEAHVKDAFSSLVPLNKYGSPDALRSMMGLHELGGVGTALSAGVATGHPVAGMLAATIPAANALMTSPRLVGLGIRAAGQTSMPGVGMIGQAAQRGLPFIPGMLSNVQGGQQ